MSELAKARKELDAALDELAAAARRTAEAGGAGESGDEDALRTALGEAEAERDALAGKLVEMQAARAKDAAMIEDALADLKAIA